MLVYVVVIRSFSYKNVHTEINQNFYSYLEHAHVESQLRTSLFCLLVIFVSSINI